MFHFLKNEMRLFSSEKSTMEDDKSTLYKLDEFEYLINKEILKGKNILVITNYLKPKSDTTYFTNGIFNFDSNKFLAKDTKIFLHTKLFDKERVYDENANNIEKRKIKQFEGKNDPRIYGVSSSGNKDETIINKGIFTSCKMNDNCPAWSLKADSIIHDKINQNVIYKNAILNVFDVPVFYFQNFFIQTPL